YVVIVAQRYGSMDGAISYTEKEYDYALTKGVPVLGFVISNDAKVSASNVESDAHKKALLDAFKAKVKRKPVTFWKTPDELHSQTAMALSKAFTTRPRPGWVRADQNPTGGTLAEITRLSTENATLTRRVKELETEINLKSGEARNIDRAIALLVANKRTF